MDTSLYSKIATIVGFARQNFDSKNQLGDIANQTNTTVEKIQNDFLQWGNKKPEQFLKSIYHQTIKKSLQRVQPNLFTEIQPQKNKWIKAQFIPLNLADYQKKGAAIIYDYCESVFGRMIVSATEKGICYAAFLENDDDGLEELKKRFPDIELSKATNEALEKAKNELKNYEKNIDNETILLLHITGTPFQFKVWKALLEIPMGQLSTYKEIACQIKNPKASRAVGTAIGSNPVALFIPCHRVVQTSGNFGGYRWNSTRKAVMIGWERVGEE